MTALAYVSRPVLFAVRTPKPLLVWIATEVGVATSVIVVVIAAVPLRHDIALPWPGLPPIVALAAGLCFWLALGLLGGSRSRRHPGGAVMTFDMPFIVGGTILGGPLAGALLGLVAELELRELRDVPWYGVLSNHAVAILSAVASGFVGELLRGPIGATLPGQPALALFVVSGAMAITFTTLNVLLVIPVLAMRAGTGLREASRTPDPSFRDRSLVEGLLAWLLAATYLATGWWATVACVALVAVAWRGNQSAYELAHDPLTGLLNERGLVPRLEAAMGLARAGRRPSAYLALDLNGLWEVNQAHGSLAGDDLLRAVAKRTLDAVRLSDAVARKANTGDELIVLLDGVVDLDAARHVAERIQAEVRRPVRLRGHGERVEYVPGIAIGLVFIERETDMTVPDVRDLAERRLEASKCRDSRIVAEGSGPTKAELKERGRRKAETRAGASPKTRRAHGSAAPRRRRTDHASPRNADPGTDSEPESLPPAN